MQTLSQQIAEKLSLSTARKYTKISDGKYKNYLENIFQGQHRIYIPLEIKMDDIEESPLMHQVAEHIKDKGVKIDQFDYLNGKILSNKNIMNIGRLLNDDPNLQKQFMLDPMRIKEGTCEIVISRHPYDIAGMSTDRGWASCMNIETGGARSFVREDIKYGTLVTYLISKNDRNINRPLSRILIKPYVRKKSDDVAYGVGSIYGIDVPFFYNTIKKWVDNTLNKERHGIYTQHPDLYHDYDTPEEVIVGNVDVQDYIKGSYTNKDGYIVITHDVTFNKERLRALKSNILPFKNMKVIVQGNLNCEDCDLTTLEGAPSIVTGIVYASSNKIQSLKGCPQGAVHYILNNNKLLTSLVGAPEEVSGDFNVYRCGLNNLIGAPRKVGGKFDCTANPLTSLEGAPQKVDIFNCSSCNLDSLKGAPKTIIGDFICNNNYIKDFSFGPEIVGGSLICQNVPLISLQGIPRYIGLNVNLTTNLGGHRFTEEEIRRSSKILGYVNSDRVF